MGQLGIDAAGVEAFRPDVTKATPSEPKSLSHCPGASRNELGAYFTQA